MNSELNQQQIDWLAQAEELNNCEAEKINGGNSAADSWLVELASDLGRASEEHLKSMLKRGREMGAIDSGGNLNDFARMNAEFQAETQKFKMYQESISTLVKSIGEGMSSVARKS